jgi:hypothetical protein
LTNLVIGFVISCCAIFNIFGCENDSIVNDQQEVSKFFNEFFINVAKDIGDKSIKINKEHSSVMKISENNTINNELPIYFPILV